MMLGSGPEARLVARVVRADGCRTFSKGKIPFPLPVGNEEDSFLIMDGIPARDSHRDGRPPKPRSGNLVPSPRPRPRRGSESLGCVCASIESDSQIPKRERVGEV